MASPLLEWTKHPIGQGAITGSASGSHGPPGGSFGHLAAPEPSRRGGQRRRRDNLSGIIHTFTPYFDGHLWRKYGQKKIKGARHPRLYFRCSYREDRHCLASKTSQQVNNDDPPLYEVTYVHEHTCNGELVPAPDIVDPTGPPDGSDGFVLSFGSSGGGGGHHLPVPPTPSPFSTMGFAPSSNSQNHHFFCLDAPPAALQAPLSPVEASWPSPPSSSSDDGDLFSVWDSFGGFGFDDQLTNPVGT